MISSTHELAEQAAKFVAPVHERSSAISARESRFSSSPILLILWACSVLTPTAQATCARPELTQQRRDAPTIQRLETAWTVAFLTGDTELEHCLLTSDFTEIMSNGSINHLSDELVLAEHNRGKVATNLDMPAITVHLHGDVAVAYGISSTKTIDGKKYKTYFADYYIWGSGAWHVYFAEQTSFAA